MSLNKYYWDKLITYWVTVNRRTGLTIPFILGAKRVINPQIIPDSSNVRDLLIEILNSEQESIITLEHCGNIREYVLGIHDPSEPKYGFNIKNEETKKTKIIATLNTQPLGNSLDEIIQSLTYRYKDCLENGNYSRIDFNWLPFTASDKKMIENALISD